MTRCVRLSLPVLVLLSAAVPSFSGEPADSLAYTLRVVYQTPGGERISTEVASTLFVPAAVNADRELGTGVGGADLTAQVSIDAGRASLRVLRLPNAPDPLPVSVEAILHDPRRLLPVPILGAPEEDLRIAFGYDALDSTAPAVYDAGLAIAGADRVTSFSLDLQTVLAGSSIAVTGEVFTQGEGGARLDPVRGRIGFSPVPRTAHVGIISGEDVGVGEGTTSIDLATDTPARATVGIEDVRGSHVQRFDVVIDKLPTTLTLTQTSAEGSGRQTLTYEASARVESIQMRSTIRNAGVLTEETVLYLGDMTTGASLVQQDADHATFTADSPIGSVTGGHATGGAVALLNDPAYLHQVTQGGFSSIAFRLLGLQSAEVVSTDPFRLAATMQAGPFRVLLADGPSTIDARLNDLPGTVEFEGSLEGGTIEYQGSAGIARATLDMVDPSGIGGTRATAAHLRLDGVPAALTLGYTAGGGTITIDAHGASIALFEVQATSGPNDRINPAYDGLLLNDLSDRYVFFGRITGLRRVVVRTAPTPDLTLDSTGGRIFKVDINQLRGGKVEYIRGTLDRLVPNMRVTVTDTAEGQTVTYTASAPTNSLVIDTNTGDRANLHISIAGPLPASLTICQASNGACSSHGSANAGSIRVNASEHTTVNFFDCIRPLSANCASAPTEFLLVSNLRIRFLEQDAAIEGAIDGERGYIYVDTDNQNLSGYLLTVNGGNGGFEVNLPAGFRAENRKVSWTFFGLFKNRSGSVVCPGGTSLRVRVLGFWLGVTSYLC